MGNESWSSNAWRTLRIRHQHIERIYGRGNADEAGDDLAEALRLVSNWPEQFPYRFREDLAHPNPYYHSLLFDIRGMPDETFERLVDLVAQRGLIEPED